MIDSAQHAVQDSEQYIPDAFRLAHPADVVKVSATQGRVSKCEVFSCEGNCLNSRRYALSSVVVGLVIS